MMINEIVKRFEELDCPSCDDIEAFIRKECEAVIEACAKKAEGWQAKWVGSTPYSDVEVGEAIRGLKGEV